MKIVEVKKNDINQRLDRFVKKNFPNISLLYIIKCIRMGKIKINDKKNDMNYRLQENDKIYLYLNDSLFENKEKISQNFNLARQNLNVVFEDQNLIIVNKPLNLSCQPDKWSLNDSLIQRIQRYLSDKGEFNLKNENSFSPSLVNRIDRNTQGLVIAAKNMLALNILNEKMKNREIKKYYLCKIHGSFDNKTDILSDFLTKQKEETGVIVSKKPLNNESSRISTQYTSLAYDKEGNAVLEINLITGKKHQIRAHMLFYNHPLFGEQKYTKKEFSDKYDNQFLVSYKVVFEFHTPSSILAYLDKKIITLDKDKIVNKLLENKI